MTNKKEINIEIQTYWNTNIKSSKNFMDLPKDLTKHPILICDIIINGKWLGSVKFDGKNLILNTEELKNIHKPNITNCSINNKITPKNIKFIYERNINLIN